MKNAFLKSLSAKLRKPTQKQLENDGIILSQPFQNATSVEIKYLLENLIPPEETEKIRRLRESFTSLGSGNVSFKDLYQVNNIYINPNFNNKDIDDANIDGYLKKFDEEMCLKRFSSTSLIFNAGADVKDSLEKFRDIEECEKNIQERKSLMSLCSKTTSNEKIFKNRKLDKSQRTFQRIHRKMVLMKKFCPEIYFSEESVIALWARGELSDKSYKKF